MGLTHNGLRMMDIVERFFNEDHWNYQALENQPVLRAGYRGERGTWICYARVDEEKCLLIFHSLMGLNIPAQHRLAVVEYLMRANYLLPVGSFEMDLETGSVRFKTSVETPENELSVAMVRSMVYTNLRMMDHFFPGVLAVVHSGLNPEAALARVEALAVEEV